MTKKIPPIPNFQPSLEQKTLQKKALVEVWPQFPIFRQTEAQTLHRNTENRLGFRRNQHF
jgi:hypothetical protein